MLLAALVSASILDLQDPVQPASKNWEVRDSAGVPRFLINENLDRLDPPKKCPKYKWQYEWVVGALGRQTGGETPYLLRARVFAQRREAIDDPAELAGRMILRLWDLNYRRLRIEHSPVYNQGIVDVYLAFGGKPGGEQLFSEDVEGNIPRKVNVIYIYAVQTFTKPLEMAREVAHEYGHAVLPQIGGFKIPEEWAAGLLGEKLFLKWLKEEIASGRMGIGDAMGTSVEDLGTFVRREVEPLIAQAAVLGPDTSLLRRPGAAAMNAYVGLALWAEALLPQPVFARSLKLTGSTSAADYVRAVVKAAEESTDLLLNIPAYLAGKQVWIPLGKGKLSGNVGIVRRKGDWALINPGQSAVRVLNRPPQP